MNPILHAVFYTKQGESREERSTYICLANDRAHAIQKFKAAYPEVAEFDFVMILSPELPR